MASPHHFFLLTTLLLYSLYQVKCAEDSDIKRLRADLLASYDKNARPSLFHTNSTQVTFNPYYRAFELDQKRSIFTLFCWTILTWNDDHLKWDQKQYGNLTKIHFAAHELWQPDLSVYNNFDQSEIDHFGNTRLVVFSTGKVFWVPPTVFKVACQLDFKRWPYDTQTCHVIIGSWAHDGGQLDLNVPTNQTMMMSGEVVQNHEWELVSHKLEARKYSYAGVTYPDILITVNIQRKSATHTTAIVVPGLTISICVLIAFWLRPESSERLVLILLLILLNSMYLNYVYSSLPNDGKEVPLIFLFFHDSLIMISFSLIWTILLRYLAATKRTSPVPLPNFINTLLNSWISTVLCLQPRPTTTAAMTAAEDDNNKLISGNNPFAEDWAWLAYLLDRFMFVIYLIVYIVFYCAFL